MQKKQDHIFSFSVSYSLRSDGTAFSTPDFIFGIQIKTHCFTRWMITENFSIPVWQ